jgi:transcriptional regulator of acetoin/glycerol metabolism
MKPRRDHARDLALAFLGAHDATAVHLQRVIAEHIALVLDAADGNLSLAAEWLGMHRRSLQRYERRHRKTTPAVRTASPRKRARASSRSG